MEYAYNEGCKEELRAIYAAEMDDGGDYGDDEFIGPVLPYRGPDEIPF